MKKNPGSLDQWNKEIVLKRALTSLLCDIMADFWTGKMPKWWDKEMEIHRDFAEKNDLIELWNDFMKDNESLNKFKIEVQK